MTTVNITPLKEKAMSFPEPAKSLILSESASMDSDEFIAKLGTWDKLLKMTVTEALKNEK